MIGYAEYLSSLPPERQLKTIGYLAERIRGVDPDDYRKLIRTAVMVGFPQQKLIRWTDGRIRTLKERQQRATAYRMSHEYAYVTGKPEHTVGLFIRDMQRTVERAGKQRAAARVSSPRPRYRRKTTVKEPTDSQLLRELNREAIRQVFVEAETIYGPTGERLSPSLISGLDLTSPHEMAECCRLVWFWLDTVLNGRRNKIMYKALLEKIVMVGVDRRHLDVWAESAYGTRSVRGSVNATTLAMRYARKVGLPTEVACVLIPHLRRVWSRVLWRRSVGSVRKCGWKRRHTGMEVTVAVA